jgi:hypothetical protein
MIIEQTHFRALATTAQTGRALLRLLLPLWG